MSPSQFAAIVGLHPNTVRMYCHQQRLTAVRIGKSYHISKDELQRYLAEGLLPKQD